MDLDRVAVAADRRGLAAAILLGIAQVLGRGVDEGRSGSEGGGSGGEASCDCGGCGRPGSWRDAPADLIDLVAQPVLGKALGVVAVGWPPAPRPRGADLALDLGGRRGAGTWPTTRAPCLLEHEHEARWAALAHRTLVHGRARAGAQIRRAAPDSARVGRAGPRSIHERVHGGDRPPGKQLQFLVPVWCPLTISKQLAQRKNQDFRAFRE